VLTRRWQFFVHREISPRFNHERQNTFRSPLSRLHVRPPLDIAALQKSLGLTAIERNTEREFGLTCTVQAALLAPEFQRPEHDHIVLQLWKFVVSKDSPMAASIAVYAKQRSGQEHRVKRISRHREVVRPRYRRLAARFAALAKPALRARARRCFALNVFDAAIPPARPARALMALSRAVIMGIPSQQLSLLHCYVVFLNLLKKTHKLVHDLNRHDLRFGSIAFLCRSSRCPGLQYQVVDFRHIAVGYLPLLVRQQVEPS